MLRRVGRLLLALICLITLPGVLFGQADSTRPDTAGVRAHLTFGAPPFRLIEPATFRAPWAAGERSLALRAMAWDSTVATALDSARVERRMALRLLTLYGQVQAIEPTDTGAPPPDNGVLGLSKKYADVALDGQVRLELRTDRLRNERCSSVQLLDPNSGCRGGFKPPRLDNQVSVRSSGVLGQRAHLAVDYDTERDFTANNNVQVFYQGLEDEIIRRIEVGTVTFLPPQSRFLTAAIPANNFGVNARFDVGPFQIQTLAATQKGSQVAERTYTIGQTTSQPQDRQVRDLDFETGRFFWVVDPTTAVPGYPNIDILNLPAGTVAATAQPTQVRVYRYRPPTNQTSDPNLGGITATARTIDPNQFFGPVRWQLLIQGIDYYLDPSGLWIALGTKLDQNDYLAVSYRTAAGTTVGSFPSADQGQGSTDSLRLIVEPKKGPESVTFRQEMRQIYRVAGTDLDPATLQVNLSVNRSERPQANTATTYLALLGLATSADQNVFDRDNRLFPRDRDPDASELLRESYIVFPTLQPFADSRLTPEERSDSLYKTPLYLLLGQGPPARFQIRLRYNSTGAGDRSTLTLGALQIKTGSEQLTLAGRRLERGVDYTISYDLGQVTFLNPDALFGGGTAQVTARFEEQGLFAVAPTTILGMATTYSLGDVGAVNLIGMYQREQSAFNRPPLGFEASANLIAGANTALHFKPTGVSRFLSKLTSKPAVAPSLLDVNAEVAMTKPDPNRSGQAYLEEFEADAGVPIGLSENSWEFGSIPQSAAGAEDIGFAGGFLPEDAVQLTWQNLIQLGSGGGSVELRPEDIDSLIRTFGRTEQQETAMYLTLHADTAGGIVQENNASRWTQPQRPLRPRWRSMVTSLSSTGLDITQDEFLEFWVFQSNTVAGNRSADSAGVRLIFDLGSVNEDALALAPDSISVNGADTSYSGRQYVGLGRLDTERNSVDIFDAQVDDHGILGDRPDSLTDALGGGIIDTLPLCQRILSNSVPVFPWGDLSSRCTRGNGTLDTEDLNGDNVLNSSGPNENVFRYVVTLTPTDKYFVRNGGANGQFSGWQLYRVPLRLAEDTIGTPNPRLIQHLRVTVAAPPDQGGPDIVAKFALARMRLVGSPWVRRAESPIAGISGSTGKATGAVAVSVISTENRNDLGYTSPPGVVETALRRGGDRQELGTQINEKSLRIIADGMEVGDRAEAYLRFPAGPQNVLSYSTLQLWMRGRGAGWEEGDYQAFVKLGSDDRNFYLYRAPAHTTTWEPEFIIDLETWRRLRADLENRYLSGAPASGAAECGGDPHAYVACEGPYLVHLDDPGINPPNLAAVQELSAGIYRVAGTTAAPETELWVDDIRLGSPVSQVGTAIALDTRFIASDVGSITASYIRKDGQFHQINTDPSYRTDGALILGTNWRLDRFLPPSLGLSVPVTAVYNRTNADPQLLTGTDIRGEALSGLRKPESWSANYTLAIRRSVRGNNWVMRGLADPLSFSAVLNQGRNVTELSDANSNSYSAALGYNLQLRRRGPRLPFGGIVGALPKWFRESEAGKGLRNANFSLIPNNIRWTSGLSRDQAEYSLFSVPVTRSDDALIRPTLSLSQLWRNSGGLTWQPLGMLSLTGDLTSTRDLRVYSDSTSLGRLAYAERRFFLGIPVGVERDRTLVTALSLTPRLSSWLRPRFNTSSNYLLSRTLTTREPVREFEDSGAFILPQTQNNSRSRDIGVSVDLSRALRQLFGDSTRITKSLARLRPVDFSTRLTRSSTYDLTAFDPDLGFMLGLGGRDAFLSHEGEFARGASETRSATVSSGADLPFGLTATVSYSLVKTERFQQVAAGFSQTSSRQLEWPVGTIRWTHTFARGPFTLLAAGAGVRHREGTSTQPGAGEFGVSSVTSSSTLNPDVQITFRNGVALTAAYASRNQRTENNGNATVLDADDITSSLSYSFTLPTSISRARKRIRSSLTAVSSKTLTCLEQGINPNCTVVSDVRRQEFRGGLDTDFLKTVSGGLQFGYSINDARHLSQKTSQLFVLLSMQLSLYAGDYR